MFLLIGLELRTVIEGISNTNLSGLEIVVTCVAVLVATIAARAVWIYGIVVVFKYGPRRLRRSAWGWDASAVVSWAGMRGVVTLAAALLLPASTPQVQLLQLAAFTVVAGTLLLQGSTLPWLIRRLGLTGPDPAEDALQAASLVNAAAQAGLQRLERVKTPEDPPEVIADLNERSTRRSNALWERLGRPQQELETPQATYRRLRLEMLDAERTSILEARDRGGYDDEVLRSALSAVDIEESILDRIDDAESRLDDELRAPPKPSGDCAHLKAAPRVAVARTPGACEECLRDGTRWVHLRLCLACGHVGCCDSSVGRHATGHFKQATPPGDAQHRARRSLAVVLRRSATGLRVWEARQRGNPQGGALRLGWWIRVPLLASGRGTFALGCRLFAPSPRPCVPACQPPCPPCRRPSAACRVATSSIDSITLSNASSTTSVVADVTALVFWPQSREATTCGLVPVRHVVRVCHDTFLRCSRFGGAVLPPSLERFWPCRPAS